MYEIKKDVVETLACIIEKSYDVMFILKMGSSLPSDFIPSFCYFILFPIFLIFPSLPTCCSNFHSGALYPSVSPLAPVLEQHMGHAIYWR